MRLPRQRPAATAAKKERPKTERPVGQSMALLTELTEHPLEHAYAARSAARVAAGGSTSSGTRGKTLFVTAVVIGLLLALAATTLRVPRESAQAAKQGIIDQIDTGQSDNDRAAARVTALRKDVENAQQARLGSGDLSAALTRTEVAAGTVAVTGPGLRMTLDDSAGARAENGSEPRAADQGSPTLTSSDLQILVNGLFQTGAEAISINGQRLTSLSAIRFAGAAILVNFRPLTRPYVVTAVGPPTMRSKFSAGASGDYLNDLKSSIQLSVSITTAGPFTVPAATTTTLYRAQDPQAAASTSAEEQSP
ncbi:DUF881 domain-containing protein [Dermacoccaceae bacterium W4C1]